MTILPITYLGNTAWWSHLLSDECVIDIGENWIKQSARNRCEIVTPNGVATLSVNVCGRGERVATRDVRIDYSKRWQHQHYQALMSAYKNSPYYDYYAEAFEPFYSKQWEWLAEYNLEIARTLLRLMGEKTELNISEKYVDATPADLDLRGKKEFLTATYAESLPTYTQVFEDRMDFVAGASIIDLFFCEGPYAASLLRR
jgi:hypothetical protein